MSEKGKQFADADSRKKSERRMEEQKDYTDGNNCSANALN